MQIARTLTVVTALLLPVALSGCGTVMCGGYERFQPSRKDTAGTKAQALKHNLQMDKNGCS